LMCQPLLRRSFFFSIHLIPRPRTALRKELLSKHRWTSELAIIFVFEGLIVTRCCAVFGASVIVSRRELCDRHTKTFNGKLSLLLRSLISFKGSHLDPPAKPSNPISCTPARKSLSKRVIQPRSFRTDHGFWDVEASVTTVLFPASAVLFSLKMCSATNQFQWCNQLIVPFHGELINGKVELQTLLTTCDVNGMDGLHSCDATDLHDPD
jgi:hypothetical protein